MELEILRSVLRVSFQDQPSVGVPMLKDLFQIKEQVLSQGRVEALLSHPLDQGNLLSHVLFAFSDVPVNLSKYFASVECFGHGDLPIWGQCQIAADYAPDRRRGHVNRIPLGALAHLTVGAASASYGRLGWNSFKEGPMIASNLHLGVNWSRDRGRQPREFPRLVMVLVVVLALVNVSATVLMAGSWASITNGMLELERSIQDRSTETVN
jgi:hypothetical protein